MSTPSTAHRPVKPARLRRWLLWLTAITLTLVMLAWLAYQQRLALLINTADTLLQPYDLQVAALEGMQVSTTVLHIRRLGLRHIDSGIEQTLRNITVGFDAAGLLRGQVNTITIEFADITIPDTGSGEAAPNARMPLADTLAAIPFNRLAIDHLQIASSSLATGSVHAEELAANLRTVQLTCRPDRCQMSAGVQLTLAGLQFVQDARSFTLDSVGFSSEAPVAISLQGDTGVLIMTAPSAALALPAIRVDDTLTSLVATIRRLNLSLPLSPQGSDPADLYGQAEISVSELNTDLMDIDLSSMQIDQQLTWERDTVHATGTLVHDNRRLLANDLQHNLAEGAGQGTLEVPTIEFNDSTAKLSDLWSPLPWPADIVAGTASGHARLNWHTDDGAMVVTGPVQATLDNLSGYFNEIAFVQLSADIAAELVPDWQLRSTRTASVNLASVDAGIELGNIHSDVGFDLAEGTITLNDASFEVFGGTVSSDHLVYRLQDNDSRFTIELDRIDLNQVLSMSAYRGVTASGLVSGQLPVRLQGLTPSVDGGSLSALPPGGTIRYNSGTASPATGNASVGNQSLDLVYQALEHYRFNLMEAQVDYQQSGELDLAIRMEGISPELNGGQRINLNLNINDDIPALLQSLQAARSVSDSIQTRLDLRQQ